MLYTMNRPRLMPMVMSPSEKTPTKPILWRFRSVRQLTMKNGRMKTTNCSLAKMDLV